MGPTFASAVLGCMAAAGPPPPPAGAPHRTVVRQRAQGDGLDAQRRLDARTPGFSTAIDLAREPVTTRADGLGDVLARVPAVRVRSLGGLGQFSAVSIRGSSAQQVQIFLDGVPVADALGGLVDLSTQPLDALDRVEIHRGYVPIAYGGAVLGGAVDLVGRIHRGPTRTGASAGYGSFASREARGHVAAELRRGVSLTSRIGYAGARGNFGFFDDGGTPQVRADDRTTRRINNGYDRVFGQVRLDVQRGRLRLSHQALAWWKQQGVPGPAGQQSTEAGLDALTVRSITTARVEEVGGPGGRVEWVGGAGVGRRRFTDPLSQVGVNRDDERTVALDGYLSPRLRLPIGRTSFFGLVADVRGEWVHVRDGAVDEEAPLYPADAARLRAAWGFAAQVEQRLFGDRLLLVPAVRVDVVDSRFRLTRAQAQVDPGEDRLDVGHSPRLGAKLRILPVLELRASVGRYFRTPTLMELFGDRGYVVGNAGLVPESGTATDGGLVLSVQRRRFGLHAHGAGFFTAAADMIQWVQTGQVVRPINLPGARIAGYESGLSLRGLGRDLQLDLAYTFLDTENRSPEAEQRGKPLPGRPRHELFARAGGGHAFTIRGVTVEPRVLYTLDLVSATFLDLSGRYQLPTRLFHGLAIELHVAGRVHLGLEARNLADLRSVEMTPVAGGPSPIRVPVSDFIGYPLPGRSFWATLGVDVELPRRKSRPS